MIEIWLAIGGIIVAAMLYVWTIYLPRQRRPDPAQRQWIVTTLESIRQEADRKRLHIHADPKIDVEEAFNQLRELMADYPGPLQERIETMAERWQDLSSQFAEFQAREAGSTLQNSLLASRTSKLANDIGELADEISTNL